MVRNSLILVLAHETREDLPEPVGTERRHGQLWLLA